MSDITTKKRSRSPNGDDDDSDNDTTATTTTTKKIRLPQQQPDLTLSREVIIREIKLAVSDALQNDKEKKKEDYDGPLLIFSPVYDFISSFFESGHNVAETIDGMIIKKAGDVLREKRFIYQKKLKDIDFPIIPKDSDPILEEEICFIDYTVTYPQRLYADVIEAIPFLHSSIIAVQLCPSSYIKESDDILSSFILRIHISGNYIIKNRYMHVQLNTHDVIQPQQAQQQGFNYEKAIAALLVTVFGSLSVSKEDSSKVGYNYTLKDRMTQPYAIYKVKIKLPISIWQIKKMLAYSINALCFFPVQGSQTECFIEFEVPTQ